MPIHLYTSTWNEEAMVPFFLQHYEPLVDRIIVYDDHSTDRTVQLLRASSKVEVRPLQREAESFIDKHVQLFETCWQESRGQADWVCLADMDEFIFHPEWHQYLAEQKSTGVTMIQALGYDMISAEFPPAGTALATSLVKGERDLHLDKTPLFAPDAIEQINHAVGRHRCAPVGRVTLPRQYRMQLRHYKNLGLDYVLARTHALATRLTNDDVARNWSLHYLRDDDSLRATFFEKLARAVEIPAPPTLKRNESPAKRFWWSKLVSRR